MSLFYQFIAIIDTYCSVSFAIALERLIMMLKFVKLCISLRGFEVISFILQNEPTSIHKKFMGDCCKRLDQLLQKLNTNDEIGSKEGKIAKTFKKPLPIKGPIVDR